MDLRQPHSLARAFPPCSTGGILSDMQPLNGNYPLALRERGRGEGFATKRCPIPSEFLILVLSHLETE